MMEQQFEVKPIGVRYICDICHIGEMCPTGNNFFMEDPPKLEHMCNQCGAKIKLTDKYPIIKYQYS
ncbi:hypothetical protein IIU_05726 [Bacillus cereus VD133]|uniref:Uncharacterized protein n=1 Tax=Bacillus cereus VD133 TaxID=1053233 RepID=A0A9W5PLW7_BACCE|nr:hypothetical protein [Bacillus cereus]EOO29044.1 hypothetical protein IIU_05726 [Bacillus cereus VD133]